MLKRAGRPLLLILLVAVAAAAAAAILGFDLPFLLLEYGPLPGCDPTGRTLTVEGVEFVEIDEPAHDGDRIKLLSHYEGQNVFSQCRLEPFAGGVQVFFERPPASPRDFTVRRTPKGLEIQAE